MKLMDKIKDLFMDEVIDDDEIELEEEEKEEYKEPPKEVLPKVMRDVIAKEEKVELKVKPEEFVRESRKVEEKVEREEEKPRKFTFPIDFDEEVTMAEKKETIPTRNKKSFEFETEFKNNNYGNGNINVLNLEKETSRKVTELYPTKKEVDIKPKFKASPVISPVYGILDKNYTKEEVKEKNDDNAMKRPSKKVDFETVRKKAFGNLADEIKDNLLCENCELYKEVKKISALKEDDLLYDMMVDEDKDVTIEKAYDNYEEFGVAYEPKLVKKEAIPETSEEVGETTKTSLDDIIKNNNALKEEETPYTRMDTKVEEILPEVIKEEEEEKEIPSRTEKKKETKVDDDFFELIDSMYKERTDD